jgi:hypothetical protein
MPSHTPRYTSGLTDADTTDVDIPCECPCTIPYRHGPHVVDDGRLQVHCPGGGANA